MAVPMPAIIVLIVCKVAIAGPPDQNSALTRSENLDWAYENSMMVCRRQEVQMYDMAAGQGAQEKPFTQMDCAHSAMLLGSQWDSQHRGSKYRFWRVACPVPIMGDQGTPRDTRDDQIVGWKIPDCGHRDTVICEVDTAI
jgi:hypothetical protein